MSHELTDQQSIGSKCIDWPLIFIAGGILIWATQPWQVLQARDVILLFGNVLVVLDVDDPTKLSDLMMRELFQTRVPFQSTRLVGDIRRGHYPFKVPNNVSYGNSLGSLGSGWGDVRGHNANTVVSPSQHAMESHGKSYKS